MNNQLTEVLSGESAPGARSDSAAPARGFRRRWLTPLLWTLGAVAGVLALLVVADIVARSAGERYVAAEIEKSLPSTVTGDIAVHIGGFSVLAQFLAGTFESIDLEAPHVTVNGAPLSASIHATGIPTDLSRPVQSATGTLRISQDSLNTLVAIPGATGDITLDDGVIGYDGTIDLLGLPVGYTVTATAKAAGGTVLLTPVDATVSAGSGDVNVTRLLQSLTARGPFPVCAAQYLPSGVEVSDIGVTPGHATVTLTAARFVMGEEFLRSRGSC